MNVYRITEENDENADGAEFYIVIAEREEEAREAIRAFIRQRNAEKRQAFVSGGERIGSDHPRYAEMKREDLEFSLNYFNNNFPNVEVAELKEGIVFTGY